MSLQISSFSNKEIDSLVQFSLDILNRLQEPLLASHVEFPWVNPSFLKIIERFPRNRLTNSDLLDAIPAELNSNWIISAGHPNIKHFSTKSDIPSRDIARCPPILHLD